MKKVFRSPCKTKGFTLVELLVVVSIVAILLLVAVSQYGSFKNARERAKAEQIVNTLRQVAETTSVYYVDKGKAPSNGISDLVDEGLLKQEPQIDIDGDGSNDPITIATEAVDGFGGTESDLVLKIKKPNDGVCDKIKEIVPSGIRCESTETDLIWLVIPDVA